MKTTLTLILLLMATIATRAQITTETIAGEIVGEMQAVIEQKDRSENYVLLTVFPPRWWDLELVISRVKQVADRYPGIEYQTQWERIPDTDDYAVFLKVNGKLLNVRFKPANVEVVFYCAL